MLARFFIDRPVLAWVISIIIVLLGAVAAVFLPVAEFSDMTPLTVQVTARYPSGSAQVIAVFIVAAMLLLFVTPSCRTEQFDLNDDGDVTLMGVVTSVIEWICGEHTPADDGTTAGGGTASDDGSTTDDASTTAATPTAGRASGHR